MKSVTKTLSREEQAKQEIGQTSISRPAAFLLIIAFLMTIYSVPVIQQIADHSNAARIENTQALKAGLSPSVRAASFFSPYDLLSVNAGLLRRINLYEDHLDDSIFLTKALNPALQTLVTGWLKGGNEQAYCGRGDWLFYRPDVEYLTGRGFLDPKVMQERVKAGGEWVKPPQPDPVKALKSMRDQLAERNIELLVLPIPSKPMIYPDKYSARYEGSRELLQNASYEEFCQRLDEENIPFYDSASLLMNARGDDNQWLYLKCDTHWSPLGMRLVAGALAVNIESLNLLSNPEAIRYRQASAEINNMGDIAAMLKLPSTQEYYQKETVSISRTLDIDGNPWRPDPDAEILFLGDSFSNIYSLDGMGWGDSAGFVETLSAELNQPIDRIVINDNGSFATRRILSRDLGKGNDRLAGKRLVIYEFAIRELSKGDWKTDLDLTLATDVRPEESTSGSANALIPDKRASNARVTGRIAEITQVPSPGTVPYKDCILSIHLVDLATEHGHVNGNEILIYAWGMRDNQLLETTELKPGQVLSLNLTPWGSVESIYGSYNRQEIDDDAVMFLDAYWLKSGLPNESDDKADEKANGENVEGMETKEFNQNNNLFEDDIPLDAGPLLETFKAKLTSIVAQLEHDEQSAWQGKEGWLFFGPEMRSLVAGRFWGDRAAEVSQSMNPKYADPLPAILDFNDQLATEGIELWIMPVPAKAAIYPSMVADDLPDSIDESNIRYDYAFMEFYQLLDSKGVNVIDLYPLFRSTAREGASLYCQQDTHWSGRAVELVARELSDRIKKRPWVKDIPKNDYNVSELEIEITGDLWKALDEKSITKETIKLSEVIDKAGGDMEITSWRESPVLLLGDSHNLVFHVGQDLHAQGAGLPDHLAKELGFAVDLVAVRGSGATPARINLLRRRDNLVGKRIVIWCFTAREFTETTDGWRNVPVIRK